MFDQATIAGVVFGGTAMLVGYVIGAGHARSRAIDFVVPIDESTPDQFSDYGRGWHRGRVQSIEMLTEQSFFRFLL